MCRYFSRKKKGGSLGLGKIEEGDSDMQQLVGMLWKLNVSEWSGYTGNNEGCCDHNNKNNIIAVNVHVCM